MRSIEITTTQNVTIEYELASVQARLSAFCLDLGIILLLLIGADLVAAAAIPAGISQYAKRILNILIFFFYTPAVEIFWNGRSPGKRALGLKVVRVDGMEATVTDYLVRWAFRLVDIYFSLGSVACLLISSTHQGQRLGDLVANTTVIRLQQKSSLSLDDILRIKSIENYEPRYPAVRSIAEADMLLVKNVLERYRKYKNASHRIALARTADILREKLGAERPADPETFLRTLISDYIVLTR